jgi:hypothetical protein
MCANHQRPGVNAHDQRTPRRRSIGAIGTAARVVVGLVFLGSVVLGQHRTHVTPAPWLLGLIGFPVVLLAWQWVRARRTPARLQATGPLGLALNCVVFFALYLTPWYAPALAVSSDATLIFYGASMWLAALRGYAGCEVTAVSNWVLHRDDQVGCCLFGPLDHLERHVGSG